MMDAMNRPMTAKKAAEYIGVSVNTFSRRKVAGTGPKQANPGEFPALYMTNDLDAYVRAGGARDGRTTRWEREKATQRRLEALQAPADITA